MNKGLLKSIWCLFAGFLIGGILSVGTDVIMEKTGIFPSFQEQAEHGLHIWWMLLLALIYRAIYLVIAGYVTAALAPNRPFFYAKINGIIATVLTLIGMVVMWDKSTAWYPIALALVSLPCILWGAKLKAK